MVGKIGVNEPCWCGSGRKYKKCHLGRGKMQPPKTETVLKEFKKSFGKKYCLHPRASNFECSGKIIKAHTIQRNGGLSRIAHNGHVYTLMGNSIMSMVKENGLIVPKLKGIGNVSTFTGFCGKHDNDVFEVIEKFPFEVNQESAFLLAYRILCRELFTKKAQNELLPFCKIFDSGKDQISQQIHQTEVNLAISGAEAGLRDIEIYKRIYDQVLLTKDYSQVKYYVVRFDRTPDILCGGGQFPAFDFDGNKLQDLRNLNEQMKHLTFSLIATKSGGIAMFSWIGENTPAKKLIGSLNSQSDKQISHSIVRYIFEFFENSYFSPNWWEGLTDKTKQSLERRFNIAISFANRKANCLLDDGVRAVSWNVISRETNIPLKNNKTTQILNSHIFLPARLSFFCRNDGAAGWSAYFLDWMLLTLMGNIVGGVSLVAVPAHAQMINESAEGALKILSPDFGMQIACLNS